LPTRNWLNRVVVALAAVAMLMPVAATVGVRPAAAASSCTGWKSTIVPPETIRVGRTDGTVATVAFRHYVGVVVAKEWPSWMPVAALKAGTTAVKQYGWWYTLAGHHRASYVTADGKCFDVLETTTDQLYKPEQVSVTSKIWRAVDATMGLSVRKDGKFFMTGYRAGTSEVCASDVDGTKLFANSVMACAEKGWSRARIQATYYAPNLTFHWADTAPGGSGLAVAIGAPRVSLRAGTTLSQAHARLTWDQAGARPAGTTYQLQRLVSGSWTNVRLTQPKKSSLTLSPKVGQAHRYRVRLRKTNGQVGAWYTGERFDARLVQDKHESMGWTSGWQRVKSPAASGGIVTYAKRADTQMAFSSNARTVAVIGTRGPSRGKARVFINGRLEAVVDLYAAKTEWRVLIFSRAWAHSATRTIRVEVVGTPGRPRVDIDGVLFYR
jgi:hypothetical protein